MFAGPLFNFLLTIAVFAVMFSIYGRFVSEPMVAEVRPDSPAAAAGFLPGDRFVSVDGTPVESFADVQRLVSGRAGDPIVFVLLRDGKEIALTATPEIIEQTDALGNIVKIGVIGVVNTRNSASRASSASARPAPWSRPSARPATSSCAPASS